MATMDLKTAIKELRSVYDLPQQKFSVIVGDGVTIATVQRWEAGSTRPHPGKLAILYQMAREKGRDDLAGVFLRGGRPAPDKGPGAEIMLPYFRDYMRVAYMDLGQVRSADEESSKLLGQIMAKLDEGARLVEKVMKDSGVFQPADLF